MAELATRFHSLHMFVTAKAQALLEKVVPLDSLNYQDFLRWLLIKHPK